MRQITIGKQKVNDDSLPFFISEVGSNHQGSVEYCKEFILASKEAGASAVKLQKRENKTFYTTKLFNEPYNNPNSFAKTYGEHREFLDFDKSQWKDLLDYANDIDVLLFSTAFDIASADFLESLDTPLFKIPSGGLKHIPLIKHVASFNKPVIISTGGGTIEDIDRVVEATEKYKDNIVLLQCTAGYPVAWEDLNLSVISTYRERYQNVIGLSSHDNGIAMALVSYMLGARVIEKHFTLNRGNKGTDNAFSLEKQGFTKMVRDIERASVSIGDGIKKTYPSEKEPLRKMATSIRTRKSLKKGHVLALKDLQFMAPDDGLAPWEIENIVGKALKRDLSVEELVFHKDLDFIENIN
jgi:sialic acid synthase